MGMLYLRMLFKDIIGLPHIKNHLTTTADRRRIPHAQLFVGKSGSGTLPMAIAYAQYILCNNSNGDNLEDNSCNMRFNNLSHPDLHFAFPVANTKEVSKHAVSNHFMAQWRDFVKDSPYADVFDWYKRLEIENKQGRIGVDEAQDVVKKLSLKAYEGGFKCMIIWGADKMNTEASNKLLKLIEEPPEKTVFLLITDDEDSIIQTILSRCQVLHFPPLGEGDIAKHLIEYEGLDTVNAQKIAHQSDGDYNIAMHLLHKNEDDALFEEWFITWVRTAFRAKGNKKAINPLLTWSETIAKSGRETQKRFLEYCQNFFRQALLINYNTPELVYLQPQTSGFDINKFAPFVHENNILQINEALQDAMYHIERNGNPKIILSDLSIKLTRFLHTKSA